MIFTYIITGFFGLIRGFISLLPEIPSTGFFQSEIMEQATDYVFNGLGLIDIFIPINILKVVITAMITLSLAKLVWSIIMFILKKVPVASID